MLCCCASRARQVAFADRILLNKTDLVAPAELEALEAQLRRINAGARLIRTRHADAPLAELLGVAAFDLARTLDMDAEFLNTEGEHQHDASVTSVGLRAEGALDLARCNAWLGALLRDRGVDIFRSKGVLCVAGSDDRFVFQGVHVSSPSQRASRVLACSETLTLALFTPLPQMQLAMGSSADGSARPWGAAEPRANRLVFIGRNLDRAALQAGFEACRA